MILSFKSVWLNYFTEPIFLLTFFLFKWPHSEVTDLSGRFPASRWASSSHPEGYTVYTLIYTICILFFLIFFIYGTVLVYRKLINISNLQQTTTIVIVISKYWYLAIKCQTARYYEREVRLCGPFRALHDRPYVILFYTTIKYCFRTFLNNVSDHSGKGESPPSNICTFSGSIPVWLRAVHKARGNPKPPEPIGSNRQRANYRVPLRPFDLNSISFSLCLYYFASTVWNIVCIYVLHTSSVIDKGTRRAIDFLDRF